MTIRPEPKLFRDDSEHRNPDRDTVRMSLTITEWRQFLNAYGYGHIPTETYRKVSEAMQQFNHLYPKTTLLSKTRDLLSGHKPEEK
jgi:hypothetical protein